MSHQEANAILFAPLMEIISWVPLDIRGTLETWKVMKAAKLSKLSCACLGGWEVRGNRAVRLTFALVDSLLG